MPRRDGLGLVEILVAVAVLAVGGATMLQMLSTNSRMTATARDHVYTRIRIHSVSQHLASFPFDELEAIQSEDLELDEATLEELMTRVPEEIHARALTAGGGPVRARFRRLMGLGLLETTSVRRGPGGVVLRESLPRIVMDETMFAPVRLPDSGEDLLAVAAGEKRELRSVRSGGDARGPAGRMRHAGGEARRHAVRPTPRRGTGGPGRSWVGGSTDLPDPLAEERDRMARKTADQLMEMLHDLYHAGEEQAEVQDLVSAVRALDRSHVGGGEQYDWGRLTGEEDGDASRRYRTAASPPASLDDVLAVLRERPIPDGDYLYQRRVEVEPGGEGRTLILYSLTGFDSRERYLLPKVIHQDGIERLAVLEQRAVADLGDRTLAHARVPEGPRPVELDGRFAHLEATCTRAYLYRPHFDATGEPVALDQVLSIRSFPAELIGDGDRPVPGEELERALAPLLAELGLGIEPLDARTEGVDTKRRLGW